MWVWYVSFILLCSCQDNYKQFKLKLTIKNVKKQHTTTTTKTKKKKQEQQKETKQTKINK